MPDSSSTPSPTGASLSDILFLFLLEKYIVCDVCGLRSPSFESCSVLYISPTDTSSMQNLILEGLQQKLQKSCSRCNKNTRHVQSSFILQPSKYLLLFFNRFRYINNNITKDRCPIPMDTTVRLGPLKFSLQATIDRHGPSIDSGHYTAYINCCKKTFYCNDHKITEFRITDKNSSTAYIIYDINGLTHDFWTRTGGWDFDRSHGAGTSSPSHWQQVEDSLCNPRDHCTHSLFQDCCIVKLVTSNHPTYLHRGTTLRWGIVLYALVRKTMHGVIVGKGVRTRRLSDRYCTCVWMSEMFWCDQ